MDIAPIVDRMEQFGATLPLLVGGISSSDARWRPEDGAWSVLEIVAHLADEELLDFRVRLESTLIDPDRAWAPTDPEAWATERDYNAQRLEDALARFTDAREENVAWLRSLRDPDWSRAYQHPRAGPLRAGDLLASWATHDALHVRQIAKRLYQLVLRDAPGFDAGYAGPWHG